MTLRGERLGIGLTLIQQLFFTLDTAAIHWLGSSVTLWQLGFIRAIGGLMLVACLAPSLGWAVFHTRRPMVQAVRAWITVAYSWVIVYSFSIIPFADATAIAYTVAIYVALLAPPILGEIVGPRRYWAVVIGALGAMLIIKPGFSEVSLIYFAVLLLTSLNALAMVLNKYLQRQGDDAATVMLYVNLTMVVSFLPAIAQPLPPIALWPWLIATCLAGPLGMFVGILAVRYADTSTLAPYSYVRLLLALAGASLAFGEPPDPLSITGAMAIVVACILADREMFTAIRFRSRG
jgi:drug/metabolite transporter (DMT)-like permease